jgi:hypothetical protein
MLRKVLVASLAVVAVSASLFAARPVEAGSCAALSEKAIGLKQSETSGRALKQLNRKAQHWAKKSGYKKVSVGKLSISCKKKGALYHCTVAAKVCGR